MKIFLMILAIMYSAGLWASKASLFCHGDGIRSTLFYFDGKISYEFVDIEFQSPKYLESYLACTNFLFKIGIKDRTRKITYASLLNSFHKKLIRFADHEKTLFYELCQEDLSCQVKFPYSLLRPAIFWKQTFHKKESTLNCHDARPILKPVALKFPDQVQGLEFWELPKEDLIKRFWKEAKLQTHEKIIISSMTVSLSFLKALKAKYKDSATTVIILASFNMMSLDETITSALANLPSNILFVPIYQNSQEPFSHHQKGALFFSKNSTTAIWNSSNFRRYETHQLVDVGMTIKDSQWANLLGNRWLKTAAQSCSELNAISCNLQTRFSNSPEELKFWKDLTAKNCAQLPAFDKAASEGPNAEEFILDQIAKAKKSIHLHTHVFGDSLIFKRLKEAQARGIDVQILGGKTSRFKTALPWVKFNTKKREYHAKFMIFDDSTFVWGTGNITKTSLSNQREDFFYGQNPEILNQLKKYFEMSSH